MTLTEKRLLAEASASPDRAIAVRWGYRGPTGRQRHFGTRAMQAALALTEIGLLEKLATESTRLFYRNYGELQVGVSFVTTFRLRIGKVDQAEREWLEGTLSLSSTPRSQPGHEEHGPRP